MTSNRIFQALSFALACTGPLSAQIARPSPGPTTITLTVSDGTPLQIALDKEERIRKVGQPIWGHVVQPVYVFDHLVVPVGTIAAGRISQIAPISGKKRTLAFLNADFTPAPVIDVDFSQLLFADGHRLDLRASVTPGSGEVIHLATAGEHDKHDKKNAVKDAAAQKMVQARQQFHEAMGQVHQPGKIHRLVRYGIAKLPVHPNYIQAGTLYAATLDQPLTFGTESMTTRAASSIGDAPSSGSLVHAMLLTPLSSATTQKGSDVEAVLTQPLFEKDRLILPQGARLRGMVLQVRPARRLHHNGQLRFTFREVVLPGGTPQRVEASLEGVQSSAKDNLQLDQEGGAKATDSKSRYFSTGLTLAFAFAGAHHDDDDHDGGGGSSAAGGAAGFKLVGIVVGLAVQSPAFGLASGIYGGGRSVYTNFLGRGHDIVFPVNTAMDIGFSGRTAMPMPIAP